MKGTNQGTVASKDYSAQGQLLQSRIALVSSKQNTTPLMAKDPVDRQAGVYAMGKRILNNKKFQALPEDNKQAILRQYYKTYVEAAYESSNLHPPDEDTWVKGMSIPGGPTMKVDDFYLNRVNPDQVSDFKATMLSMGAGFIRTAANMIRGPVIAGMKVDSKLLGLQPYFNAPKVSSTMAAENVPGLVEAGNLPIWNRPSIKNADGTHSSEYSTSFQDDKGREVLVPTVVNGRFLTPDGKKPKEGSPEEKEMFRSAWGHYLATGENLGKFSDYKAADAYANILHNRGEQPDPDSWKASYVKLLNKISDSGVMKSSQDTIDNINFWFASRPSEKFSETAGTFVGEQLAQLPLYKAIGLVGKAGLGAVKANKLLQVGATAEGAGTLVRAANFTRRLAATPAGRQIGTHLAQAAEGYIGGVIQNESSHDAKMDAISFAALGIIGADLGTVAKQIMPNAAKNAMKKFMAKQAAVGGLPLIEATHDQAVHELDNNIIGTGHNGEPLVVKPEHTEADIKEGLVEAKTADPIKHNQVTAAKLHLITVAKELYGEGTIWRNLGKSKKDAVRAEVEKRATEAIEEIPIHEPKAQAHEIKESIKKDVELSPQLAHTYAEIDQMFPSPKLEDAVAQQERDTIAADTGLKTSQGTVEKVSKSETAIKAAKASGIRKGPRTQEDEIFNDFSDFGTSKYNFKDESFNIQFASKADRALYNTRKTPLQYRGLNKEVPVTYHSTKAKLKQHFTGKTDQELQGMSNEVKARVDKAVKERLAHPEYKAGTMKYGSNIRIEPVHGTSPTVEERVSVEDNPGNDPKKELLNDFKKQIDEFAVVNRSIKQNYPEVYKAGLDALLQMQVIKMSELGVK